ncbi:MAG: hypothetical protein QOD26_3220 [Betaproteobacteria bacterium]|jgi:hypothetical protein|nr:hypothetical protein [Betaproteobacteria bacterium]
MLRAFLIVLLAGCTSVGTVDKDVAPPKGDEVLYVMGVSPENHRIQIMDGDVEYGLFKPNKLAMRARLYSAPTDGYVVWKGTQSEALAVSMVRVVKEKDDILGLDFRACGEQRTMVFRAPAGKVVYVGDVAYQFRGKSLSVRYNNDLKAAQAFVERNYPQLKAHVTQGKFELLPTSNPCAAGGGVTVPIYIPAPRR